MSNQEIIIGIDLGTTNSISAVIEQGSNTPKIIRDYKTGSEILPSVVGIDPKSKELIFGDVARRGLEQYPNNFVKEIKRQMGKENKVKMGNKELLPEQVSALILKYIKHYSEEAIGKKINKAIITVPANFNNKQRNATIEAGKSAGFKVERIINEPTAAALAYGLENKTNKHVMVYDLGGGTFDVTVLEYNEDILDIKASAGDVELGGKDFDYILFNYVCNEFKKKHGVNLVDDEKIKYRLLNKCEEAKKELSFKQISSLIVPNITSKDGKLINLEMDIQRSKFESLIKDEISKTQNAIEKSLDDAKLTKEDIDTILLVGGSTRIPYVKNFVESIMGKATKQTIDSQRVVAKGAAIQGGIIEGKTITIIMDICPLSLGTEVVAEVDGQIVPGLYDEIIPANTPQLKDFSKTYYTVKDNQKSVTAKVYQKDSLSDDIWAKNHTFLGEKLVKGIPPNDAGKESITVRYRFNLNGILKVDIKIDSTEELVNFEVDTKLKNEKNIKQNIEDIWQESEKAGKIKATISAAEKLLSDIGEHEELQKKIYKLKEAVVKNNDEKINVLDDEVTDLIFELQEE